MSTAETLQAKFPEDELVFSDFRDNHRVVVPAVKLMPILSTLK